MAATVDRHNRKLGNLAKTQDVAEAVRRALEGERRHRIEWWHLAVAFVALAPAYVTMVIVLSGLGR